MSKPHLRLHYWAGMTRTPWRIQLVRPGAGIRVLTGHHYTLGTLTAAGAVQAARMLWWP